ncbi:MAG: GxxExxY protein [Candidatus Cloacimonetes bacterium]|jgi:GxxExxY protein|nr:GxxExxY protein [Candidatus Cloacimonadota bacterium]
MSLTTENTEGHRKMILEDESYKIRGAVFEVYKELGSGFLEAVYQECLEKEFTTRGIPFIAQPELIITYKGEPLNQRYKPDFICYDCVILELKTAKELLPEHRAQIINYLKATQKPLGFLINFNSHPQVKIERFVL